jgi:predicted nucleotide-binding protein
MLPRFEGPGGKQRLAEVLRRQTIVGGDNDLAAALANNADLLETQPSQAIMEQGGADNNIYFIISGSVDILINGRIVAKRIAGTHVGEMALIDPTARRSATVRSSEPCVFAWVSESDFSSLAQTNPHLWRAIAVELGNRLRERTRYIRPPHNQPVVFVGSCSEQLEIAREIQLGLSHDPMVIQVWTDGIFRASRTTIENLLAAVGDSDFAVLVVSPDDLVQSRGLDAYGPRDNVLFELGLFMGGISRDRTFVVRPRCVDLKIPSDLLGFTPLDYASGEANTLTARIAPVCTELRRGIMAAGPK